jgi:hypothetical protein
MTPRYSHIAQRRYFEAFTPLRGALSLTPRPPLAQRRGGERRVMGGRPPFPPRGGLAPSTPALSRGGGGDGAGHPAFSPRGGLAPSTPTFSRGAGGDGTGHPAFSPRGGLAPSTPALRGGQQSDFGMARRREGKPLSTRGQGVAPAPPPLARLRPYSLSLIPCYWRGGGHGGV